MSVISIIDELEYFKESKNQFKEYIQGRGATIDDQTPFRQYTSNMEGIEELNWSVEYWGSVQEEAKNSIPSDWLQFPETIESDKVVYLLLNVYDGPTDTVSLFQFSNNYQVDWGDGSAVENFAGGNNASHVYDFNAITNPVNLEGNKQVIVAITPQDGISTLGAMTTVSSFLHPFLVGAVVNDSGLTSTSFQNMYKLEYVDIRTSSSIYLWCFRDCYNLKYIKNIQSSTKMTTLNNTFTYCYNLKTIPFFDTSQTRFFSQTFLNCYSLKTLPFLDTSSTEQITAFRDCHNLTLLPPLDLTNIRGDLISANQEGFRRCYNLRNSSVYPNPVSGYYLYEDCHSIEEIPPMVLTGNASYFARRCYALKSASVTIDSSVPFMLSMFEDCYSLKTVDMYVDPTTSVRMDALILNCYSLETFTINPNARPNNLQNIFNSGLKTLPMMDTSEVTTIATTVSFVSPVTVLPAWDMSGLTSPFTMNAPGLRRSQLQNVAVTHSYMDCLLSREALVEVFQNLAVAVDKSITITGNPGVTNLTIEDCQVAWGKGWDIIGAPYTIDFMTTDEGDDLVTDENEIMIAVEEV